MKKKTKELLKSGNFTICYHDKEYFTIHEGRKSYDKCSDDFDEDGEPKNGEEFFDHDGDGYAPEIIIELAKILGGKVVSI